MPNFIDLKDLNKDQLIDLISLSLEWKNNNCVKFMKDKNVVLIFEKPSLRTRISFEVARINFLKFSAFESLEALSSKAEIFVTPSTKLATSSPNSFFTVS